MRLRSSGAPRPEAQRSRLTIGEVAAALGVTSKTALRLVRGRSIPGGTMLYRTEKGRERWVVNRAVFEQHLSLGACQNVQSVPLLPPSVKTGSK